MEILGYKSKFRMIFDLLFNYKKVNSAVFLIERETLIKANALFDNKINMIAQREARKGIVKQSYQHTILEIPLFVDLDSTYNIPKNGDFDYTYNIPNSNIKKIKPLSASFNSYNLTTEEIKMKGANILARRLVDEDFLEVLIKDNRAIVIINTF